MIMKRLWIALLAIPVCLMSVLIIGAQRSHPANAGGVIDPTCTSSSPCIEYDNNSIGSGIRGVSLSGNGSVGFTKVNSTSATNGREGVFGDDLSTSGTFNSGVHGLSVRGTGVSGTSTSGAGVLGQTSNGAGVSGLSSGGSGVSGKSLGGKGAGVFGSGVIIGVLGSSTSSSGTGVAGSSTSGPGVSGTSSSGDGVDGSGNTGVFGSGTNIGVLGHSTSGEGVLGTSTSGVAVSGTSTSSSGVLGSTSSSSSSDAGVQGTNGGSGTAIRAKGGGGPLFIGNNLSGVDVFTVDDTGNVHAHSFTANLAAATGQKVVTYSPQATEPTIEDFGEAQLTNGSAYVHIDIRFTTTMARGVSYLVFITPEGDNRGLYVSQKSTDGFAVRESQGGHSSLAFSYRIVAKPFGNQAPRLPLLVEHRVPMAVPRLHN